MASGVGAVEMDFGAHPGTNEAIAVIIGQTDITPSSSIEAWIMADDTTADHTAADHKYAPLFIGLTCGDIVDGVGFTIHGRSLEKLTGAFAIRWVWSS